MLLFLYFRNGINVGGLNISSRNPNDVLSKSQPTGRFMADKVIKIWDVSKQQAAFGMGLYVKPP